MFTKAIHPSASDLATVKIFNPVLPAKLRPHWPGLSFSKRINFTVHLSQKDRSPAQMLLPVKRHRLL